MTTERRSGALAGSRSESLHAGTALDPQGTASLIAEQARWARATRRRMVERTLVDAWVQASTGPAA